MTRVEFTDVTEAHLQAWFEEGLISSVERRLWFKQPRRAENAYRRLALHFGWREEEEHEVMMRTWQELLWKHRELKERLSTLVHATEARLSEVSGFPPGALEYPAVGVYSDEEDAIRSEMARTCEAIKAIQCMMGPPAAGEFRP